MTLPHSLDPLVYPARFQFGQAGQPWCLQKTACTDTCIQMVIEYYKERTVSLSQIRAASGRPIDCVHGLNAPSALRALSAFGVSYNAAWNIDANFVLNKLQTGPVIVATKYGLYPNDASGKCGTYNRAQIGGRTDCGFTGAHAVLVLRTKDALKGLIITRDPDHNSPSRPEQPKFDVIGLAQLDKAMKGVTTLGFSGTVCYYPTKKKVL